MNSMEQISLFVDEHILANTADADLAALRLLEAQNGYKSCEELYGENAALAHKWKIANFLRSGLDDLPSANQDCPDGFCELWDAFETYAQSLEFRTDGLLADIKQSFFQYVLNFLHQNHANDLACAGKRFPLGFVYLQAGEYAKAVDALRARVAAGPQDARIYGYLGDALYLCGNTHAAGQCYFEAFLIDSAAIDWRHMQYSDLVSLKEELMENDDEAAVNGVVWIAPRAYIGGLISSRRMMEKSKFANIVERYLEKENAYLDDRHPDTAALIFLMGIMLCENQVLLGQINGIDLALIRRRMKEINPLLFTEYLQKIARQEKLKCSQ